MSIANDTYAFFTDLAEDVLINSKYGKGLLEQPTAVALNGEIIYYDYRLYLKQTEFSDIKTGDTVEINNIRYSVRQVDVDLDGKILEVTIQKT